MFCDKCGAKLKDGAKFCDKCGAKIVIVESDSIQSTKNRSENIQEELHKPERTYDSAEAYNSKNIYYEEKQNKPTKIIVVALIVFAIALAVALVLVFIVIKPFNNKELTKYDSYTKEEFSKKTSLQIDKDGYFYFSKDVKVQLGYSSKYDSNYAYYSIEGDAGNPTEEQKQYSVLGLKLGTNYDKDGVEKMLLNKGFQLIKKDDANLYSLYVANGPIYVFETPREGQSWKRIQFYVSDQTGEITSKIDYASITINHNRFEVSYIFQATEEDNEEENFDLNDINNNSDEIYNEESDTVEPFTELEIRQIASDLGFPADATLYWEQGEPRYEDVYGCWRIYVQIWDDEGGYGSAGVEPGSLEFINAIMGYTKESDEEEYILPNSDKYTLTEVDLVNLSPQELTYARNEIYARYGYIFQSQELNEYFATKDWYYPDSNIDQSVLSQLELKNADFIRQYQDFTGKQYRPN